MPARFCSSSIHLIPHYPFSHPSTLFPPFLFSPGTGLICGLRIVKDQRIGENWKKGGNMKGRSWREQEVGSEQGRGGQVRENAREWSNDLAAPAIVKGRKGGVQRHEAKKKEWEGKREGVLINMASRHYAIPLILSPTLYHFPHQLPTHKTLINKLQKKWFETEFRTIETHESRTLVSLRLSHKHMPNSSSILHTCRLLRIRRLHYWEKNPSFLCEQWPSSIT